MPAGLKQTSSVVSIGFSAVEAAPNTFTQTSVDLNLSPLDREVFVVLAINLDAGPPDLVAATNTSTRVRLSTTSQTAIANLEDSNVMAALSQFIISDAANSVPFTSQALETPPSTLEYIGIIATNDFFVQIEGTNNTLAKGMSGKLYGYRARADASIYSALVQSEVLSS